MTTITTTDLAADLAEQYDIADAAARDGVDVYLGQLIDIDGEQAAIAARDEVRNGSGRLIGESITLTGSAAAAIRESFAAYYADAH